MRALYEGSRIPDAHGPAERISALRSEHQSLSALFRDLGRDPDRKISDARTLAACAIASAQASPAPENVIAIWGEEHLLRGSCAVMMTAVHALIRDEKARFGDDSIWPRLCDAARRTTPANASASEDADPAPDGGP